MQYVLALMVSDTAKANQLAGYESKGCWGPGGVHDLRMDGGLPPGFQKGTLF